MGALSADVAVEEIGEHHLRITLERIAPAAATCCLGADNGLLRHRQTIDPGRLPLFIFWRLDPVGAAAAQLATPQAPRRIGVAPVRRQAPTPFFQRPDLQAQAEPAAVLARAARVR